MQTTCMYQCPSGCSDFRKPSLEDFHICQSRLDTIRKALNKLNNHHVQCEHQSQQTISLINEVNDIQDSLLNLSKRFVSTDKDEVFLLTRIRAQLQQLDGKVLILVLSNLPMQTLTSFGIGYVSHGDPASLHQLNSSYDIPPITSRRLIDNEEALLSLQRCTMQEQANLNIVNLYGPSRSGKTITVIQFISDPPIKTKFESVLWINGSSLISIRQQLSSIVDGIARQGHRLVTMESKLKFLQNALSALTRPILFVLDNFNDSITFNDLEEYMPKKLDYTLLVVTEAPLTKFSELIAQQIIKMPTLTVEHATKAFFDLSDTKMGSARSSCVRRIVNKFGCHQSSIAIACRCIRGMSIGPESFEDQLNVSMMVRRETRESIEPMEAIPMIWFMSLSNLAPSQPAFAQNVSQVLLFCTFIHHHYIDDYFGTILFRDMTSAPSWMKPYLFDSVWQPEAFMRVIRYLDSHELLESCYLDAGKLEFSLDPSIKHGLWDQQSSKTLVDNLVFAIKLVLGALNSCQGHGKPGNFQKYFKLYISSLLRTINQIENLKRCSTRLEQHTRLIIESKYAFVSYIQKYSTEDDEYSGLDIAAVLKDCLAAYSQSLGRFHYDCIRIADQLGDAYSKQKDYLNADLVLRCNLQYTQQSMSSSLALCLLRQGKISEAHQAFDKILIQWKSGQLGSGELLDYLKRSIYCILESADLSEIGDISAALEDVIPINKEEALIKADLYLKLSHLYWHQNEKVKSIYNQVKEASLLEHALGPNHRRYLLAAYELCRSCAAIQQWDICQPLYRKIIEGYTEIETFHSEQTNKVLHDRAHALLDMDKEAEAMTEHINALDNLLSGPDHDSKTTKEIFSCLSDYYQTQSKLSDLIKLYRKTIDCVKQWSSTKTQFHIALLRNLSSLQCQQNNWAEATITLTELTSPDEWEEPWSIKDSNISKSDLLLLAHVFSVQERYEEAESAYRRILALKKQENNYIDEDLLHILLELDQICESQGKIEDARAFQKEYIRLSRGVAAKGSTSNQDSVSGLEQSHNTNATTLPYGQDHTISSRALFPENPDGCSVKNPLAETQDLRQSRIELWIDAADDPWMAGVRKFPACSAVIPEIFVQDHDDEGKSKGELWLE